MAIYITGDTHGGMDSLKLSSKNFPNYRDCSEEDYLIITGDWGYVFNYNPTDIEIDDEFKAVEHIHTRNLLIKERNILKNTFDKKFITLICEGNHENFDRLKNFPKIDMFGSKVRKITDKVFLLKRGEIYNIEGKSIFVFGGARSIDRFTANRQEGIDWFPQEECTYKEENYALDNLKKYNNKVDIVITHTCATSTVDELSKLYGFYVDEYDNQNKFLEFIKNEVDYSLWFFGHFHHDLIINDKEILIYNKVRSLDEFI